MALDILLSNDDGYDAPGIMYLEQGLSARGHRVQVIAPECNCSGASSSITLRRPLHCRIAPNGYWYIDGSPADCIRLGILELCKCTPDVIISGINAGSNMGDDMLYSGTVAAAIQGYNLGIHAIAISLVLDNGQHYRSAVIAAIHIVERLMENPPSKVLLLNVNVPDIYWEAIHGFRSTHLGSRHKDNRFFVTTNSDGENAYWYGPLGDALEKGQTTDFCALEEHFVSVSAIKLDWSDYANFVPTERWLND